MSAIKVDMLSVRAGVYLTDDSCIHVPGLCNKRPVIVEDTVVTFTLGKTVEARAFGSRLIRYCEAMKLSYELGE